MVEFTKPASQFYLPKNHGKQYAENGVGQNLAKNAPWIPQYYSRGYRTLSKQIFGGLFDSHLVCHLPTKCVIRYEFLCA